jgi:hypothetical protein
MSYGTVAKSTIEPHARRLDGKMLKKFEGRSPMRSTFTVYPVRRTSLPRKRRKRPADSFSKMLAQLDVASDRLARARRGR